MMSGPAALQMARPGAIVERDAERGIGTCVHQMA